MVDTYSTLEQNFFLDRISSSFGQSSPSALDCLDYCQIVPPPPISMSKQTVK